MAVNIGVLQAKLTLDDDQFQAALQQNSQQAQAFSSNIQKSLSSVNAQGLATALQGVAGQLDGAANSLRAFGAENDRFAQVFRDLEKTLEAGFGSDVDLNPLILSIRDLETRTDFSASSLAKLASRLKALDEEGEFSERRFRNIISVASALGLSVDRVQKTFTKLDLGDTAALKQAEEQFGITADQIKSFGGDLDALVESLPQFDNGIRQVLPAAEDLEGRIEALRAEVGLASKAVEDEFAERALEPLVEILENLRPSLKAAVGITTEFGGTVLSAGASALQTVANFALLGASASALGITVGSLTAAFTIANAAIVLTVGTLIAVPAALLAIESATRKANIESSKLIELENQKRQAFNQTRGILSLSAEELRDQGKTTRDVIAQIEGLQLQREDLVRQGNDAGARRLEAQIAAARQLARDLEALKPGTGNRINFELKAQNTARLEQEAKTLRDKLTAEDEKARAEEVRKDLAAIQLLEARENLSVEQRIAIRQRLLDKSIANEQQRQQLVLQIAQIERRAADEAAKAREDAEKRKRDAADKTEADRKAKAAAEEADRQRELEARRSQLAAQQAAEQAALQQQIAQGTTLDIAAISAQIGKLQEEREKKGTDVENKIIALIQERLALQQTAIDRQLEADLKGVDNAELRAQLEANAQKEKAALIQEAADAEETAHQAALKQIEERKTKLQEELDKKKEVAQTGTEEDSDPSPLISLEELGRQLSSTARGTSQSAFLTQIREQEAADQARSQTFAEAAGKDLSQTIERSTVISRATRAEAPGEGVSTTTVSTPTVQNFNTTVNIDQEVSGLDPTTDEAVKDTAKKLGRFAVNKSLRKGPGTPEVMDL